MKITTKKKTIHPNLCQNLHRRMTEIGRPSLKKKNGDGEKDRDSTPIEEPLDGLLNKSSPMIEKSAHRTVYDRHHHIRIALSKIQLSEI